MTPIQQANAAYIDYEPSPKIDWRDMALDARSDAEIVLSRFSIYAHGQMEWLELSTSWLPFIQIGPQERKSWSKRRLAKAIDALVDLGLIEDVDGSDCKWRLTQAGG